MGRIMQGAEFGTYKTIAMSLGTAKNENNNGVKSRYIVLTLKNKKCLLSGSRRTILWDEDFPGLFDQLKPYAAMTPDAQGGYLVDLPRAKAEGQVEMLDDLLEIPGGVVLEYKLAKGMCYQNDVNGAQVYIKGTTTPVTKDKISVFCIIDHAVEQDNKVEYHWVDKFGLAEQGSRMENRFYRKAVNAETANEDIPATQPAQSTPAAQSAQAPAQPADTQAAPAERPF